MNDNEEYPTMGNPYQCMGNYDPLPAMALKKQQANGYDPIHAAMVKRKQRIDNGEELELPPKEEYKNEDIKALEEFCKKHGIMAMNFGNIPPSSALRMLKSKMGIQEAPVTPLTNNNKKSLLLG